QMLEGRGRGRVSQVIRRNVNGLNGSNGTDLGRGNTLLQATHFVSQGRLVTYSGRHTAEQRGHFGTSQCVAVDIVNEEQHVTAFVTEFFRHGQTRQRYAQTVTRWFVHLTEHHRHLGFLHVIQLDNASLC